MEFAGGFETHVTVAFNGNADIDGLCRWSRQYGLKCLDIVLERGRTLRQPMLTRHGFGTLSCELAAAVALSRRLFAAGYSVKRIKIEAAVTNDEIPQSDADAAVRCAELYFEHHVKLLLKPHTNLATLGEIAQQHGAHVSRNALRVRTDEFEERFVTQRCRRVGRTTARHSLEQLLERLSQGGYKQIAVEEEFVVFDNNLEIDAGWIEGKGIVL